MFSAYYVDKSFVHVRSMCAWILTPLQHIRLSSLLIFLHESIVHSFCLVSCSMRELTIDTICIFNYQLQGDTINREIFVLKNVHAIIFRVKIFSYANRPYN